MQSAARLVLDGCLRQEAKSKLILAVHVSGTLCRTMDDAMQFVHQMASCLVPGCFPVYTSDGLNHYFYGLTAHFGYWDKPPRARKFHWFPDDRLLYAQIRKDRNRRSIGFLYT
jgi:hypothetical protein